MNTLAPRAAPAVQGISEQVGALKGQDFSPAVNTWIGGEAPAPEGLAVELHQSFLRLPRHIRRCRWHSDGAAQAAALRTAA